MTRRFKKKQIPATVKLMGYFRNNFLPLLGLVLLLLMIPVTVDLGQRVSRFFSEAAAVPANIIVDAGIAQGALPRPWEGLAQGGELENDKKTLVSILPITGRLQNLNIKYVRFDHIFNFPLEERMKEIRAVAAMGAFPVISLSYYPASVAKSWTGRPYNWAAWETEVASLITRISKDTPNVYYEVWNEPDGKDFGNMNPAEYLILYRHTVAAAGRVKNTQPFKIGGPSLANPDNKNWMREFTAGVAANNFRLDFISWHRYHKNPQVFTRDLDFIDDLLFANNMSDRERLITEWGTDPQPKAIHLSNYEAAHFAAVTRQILDRVKVATKFEARDGLTPGGGLGIYTYNGGRKPITIVYEMLSKVSGNRILLGGEGTNVTGFATKSETTTFVFLVNFDVNSNHLEEIPINIRGLNGAKAQIKKTILDGFNPYGRTENKEFDIIDSQITFSQIMQPNSVLLMEINGL